MDISLYKRMGVHDGKVMNEHLYGMPHSWRSESGSDHTRGHSDKSCIKHGTTENKPNMRYYAEGGAVEGSPDGAPKKMKSYSDVAKGLGDLLHKRYVEPGQKHRKKMKEMSDKDKATNLLTKGRYYNEGGEVCEKGSRRKRLAVGAVAKIRKGQY